MNKYIFLVIMVILILIFVCLFFNHKRQDILVIDTKALTKINVFGTFNYIDKHIIQAKTEELIMKYDRVYLDILEQTLNSIAYVDSVNIQLHDDILSIFIDEIFPIAIFNENKLLTNTGIIFYSQSSLPEIQLPYIYGADGDIEKILFLYLTINYMLSQLHFSVQSLRVNYFSGCHFTVDNIQVNVSCNNIIKNVQQFITLYKYELINSWLKIKKIDMRNLNGSSVTWNS